MYKKFVNTSTDFSVAQSVFKYTQKYMTVPK